MYEELTDITNVTDFTRGVARYTLIAKNILTQVQAWRRSYFSEPWRDRVEFITPQAGKFYPEENRIKRTIPFNCPKMKEKIEYYLQNGLEGFFPGDNPEDEDNDQ